MSNAEITINPAKAKCAGEGRGTDADAVKPSKASQNWFSRWLHFIGNNLNLSQWSYMK